MSQSIPVALDSVDPLGAAIRLRAAREGSSPEEVVHGILRKALAPRSRKSPAPRRWPR